MDVPSWLDAGTRHALHACRSLAKGGTWNVDGDLHTFASHILRSSSSNPVDGPNS